MDSGWKTIWMVSDETETMVNYTQIPPLPQGIPFEQPNEHY